MKNSTHGGNIYKKAKELGLREDQILDYSANISPLGIPAHIKKAMVDAIEGSVNYPDPDCTALREAIGRQDGVEPGAVACGNGGADLLYRLAFGLKPEKVLLPVPAFVEYEEAMTAAGAQMVYEPLDEEMCLRPDVTERITGDIDLVILCNPNNPTGLPLEPAALLKFIERVPDKCVVVLDEAYTDFMDPASDETAFDEALKIAGGRHDLVGIRVYDRRETELPDVGAVELLDAESGRRVWVDTSSRRVREEYAEDWRRRNEKIETTLKHHRIDTAVVSTSDDYVSALIKLFKER